MLSHSSSRKSNRRLRPELNEEELQKSLKKFRAFFGLLPQYRGMKLYGIISAVDVRGALGRPGDARRPLPRHRRRRKLQSGQAAARFETQGVHGGSDSAQPGIPRPTVSSREGG